MMELFGACSDCFHALSNGGAGCRVHVPSDSDEPHPWYGPCDAMGDGDGCSVCVEDFRSAWLGPLWNDCEECNWARPFAGDEAWRMCLSCQTRSERRLYALTSSLRIGAALCEAHELGVQGSEDPSAWHPGCGRSAGEEG